MQISTKPQKSRATQPKKLQSNKSQVETSKNNESKDLELNQNDEPTAASPSEEVIQIPQARQEQSPLPEELEANATNINPIAFPIDSEEFDNDEAVQGKICWCGELHEEEISDIN